MLSPFTPTIGFGSMGLHTAEKPQHHIPFRSSPLAESGVFATAGAEGVGATVLSSSSSSPLPPSVVPSAMPSSLSSWALIASSRAAPSAQEEGPEAAAGSNEAGESAEPPKKKSVATKLSYASAIGGGKGGAVWGSAASVAGEGVKGAVRKARAMKDINPNVDAKPLDQAPAKRRNRPRADSTLGGRRTGAPAGSSSNGAGNGRAAKKARPKQQRQVGWRAHPRG